MRLPLGYDASNTALTQFAERGGRCEGRLYGLVLGVGVGHQQGDLWVLVVQLRILQQGQGPGGDLVILAVTGGSHVMALGG